MCLFGPNANDTLNHMGEYVPRPRFVITPYQAFQALLPNTTVVLAVGCNLTSCVSYDPGVVAVAATCDVNVLVMGLTAYARSQYKNESAACGCPQGDAVEGEVSVVGGVSAPSVVARHLHDDAPRSQCCDRYDVELPGSQLPFIEAVAGVGKPTVLVTVNAGMLNLTQAIAAVDAVLVAPYLTQFAGTAIAEAVLGIINPAGRLTTTWYRDWADVGDIHDYSMAQRTYRFFTGPTAFPFGYGGTYTTFTYSALRLNVSAVAPCDWVAVEVTVTNTGLRDGSEVVQLYLSTDGASVPLPVKQLVDFDRVAIAVNGSATVRLTVSAEAMAIMRDGDYALVSGGASAAPPPRHPCFHRLPPASHPQQIEPGLRTLWVGASSDSSGGALSNGLAGSFQVIGAVTPFASCSTTQRGAAKAPVPVPAKLTREWQQRLAGTVGSAAACDVSA